MSNANPDIATQISPEQAVAFAALVLADDNLAVTPERLQTLLQAAAISDIEPIWTTLFANALKDKNVKDILTAVAASGPKAGSNTARDTDHGGGLGGNRSDDEDIHLCGCENSDEEPMFGLFD